jgi:hypothetical protein
MSLEPPAPKKPAKNPSDMTEEELKRYKAERERQKREKGAHIPMLGRYAQLALNYIMNTQHGQGGWRYSEGQAGDTSVVGWMLMALKSGHMAKLQVRPRTVAGCSVFLKSVQGDDYGSIYHYTAEKKRDVNALHATTAIGLLCRMYMGWDRAHPGITEGVQKLSNWNYSSQDMYYDYYATQVMSHYGSPDGALWKKWNTGMRDYLVEAQVKQENHMKGSWMFTGGHGASAGGRLYNTAMGCMILEVYYRYMPIYGKKSIEENLENPGDAKGEEKGKEKKEKK